MSYQQIGALVTKAQELLDTIKGGGIQAMEAAFNSSLALWNSKVDSAVATVSNYASQLPCIALTDNQVLKITEGKTIPDTLGAHANVSIELVALVHNDPAVRDAATKSLLTSMESDVRKEFPDFNIIKDGHYSRAFNVVRVSWDFTGKEPNYLVFPTYKGSSVPLGSISTAAAFVKLESGEIYSPAFATGATLGEWRFTRKSYSSNSFGDYLFCHPYAKTPTGSMLIALPVVATGYIDHPKKLFALPEISE